MTLPNFLIIGAAKCGTDALCNYLAQHPQVYISPNKEPNFFIVEGQAEIPYRGPGDRETLERWDGWVSTLEHYQALFAGVGTEKAIGEGSTWYIYDEQAPRRIHRYVPDVRLIAVLRNPADRAYSAYTMLMRDGRETLRDFSQALAAEDERVRANWEPLWHYRRMGFYAAQLKRYYAVFDPAQIRVVVYDDFNARPADTVRELFRFLEVDDQFAPDVSTRHNVSLVPRHPTYQRLIAGESPLKSVAKALLPAELRWRVKQGLLSPNLTRPAPLAPEVRHQLIEIFRPDILELQDLIGRDLSHWLR
jgi:hypothetical protein